MQNQQKFMNKRQVKEIELLLQMHMEKAYLEKVLQRPPKVSWRPSVIQ